VGAAKNIPPKIVGNISPPTTNNFKTNFTRVGLLRVHIYAKLQNRTQLGQSPTLTKLCDIGAILLGIESAPLSEDEDKG